MMDTDTIRAALTKYSDEEVNNYINYLNTLANEKKQGKHKNPWIQHRSDDYLINCFNVVKKDDLDFDGKHITLQSTGISYDYVAYKNKMINIYPESLFDVQLVKNGDKFKFSKESGRITYQHEIVNPFGDSEIVGAYCIIKNKRGEFLTALSRTEINKHRMVAKTDYIWSNWLNEMVMKTIVKKACKTHFSDVYHNIETLDNEQYDLEQPLNVNLEVKQAIEAINCMDKLKDFYNKHKDENAGTLEGFTRLCTKRKEELIKVSKESTDTKEESLQTVLSDALEGGESHADS